MFLAVRCVASVVSGSPHWANVILFISSGEGNNGTRDSVKVLLRILKIGHFEGEVHLLVFLSFLLSTYHAVELNPC